MRHPIHESSPRVPRLAGASLAVALFATVTTAPAWAQSNRSIINGGFEQPPVPAGTFQIIDENNIPGWETSATDSLMELWGTGFLGVPAFAGNQFAELNANQVATLFQPLCLVPGDTVNWSFAHRGRSGTDTIRLTIGTDQVTTESTGSADWAVYSGTYTPTITASAPVQFFFESVDAAGGSGSAGNFLDAVEIVLPPHFEVSGGAGNDDEATGGNLPVLLVSGTMTTPGTVDVTVSGTATAGEDFTFATTVTIPAGEYDGTLATAIPLVTIVDDQIEESDETIVITIANPTGENQGNTARIADVDCNDTALSTATYTINDDDGTECGDGTAEPGESCDDGNLIANDGCSSACTVETDYVCARADFSLVAEDSILDDTGDAPVWDLSADGFTVFQGVNSDPGVYVSSLPAMNIGDIEFSIAVETTGDDDFVGVVLGFDGQEFDDADASYLLIDWKQATQATVDFGTADEGLAVSLITGATNLGDLWSHPETSTVRELVRGTNFGNAGWEDNVSYTWTLNYTETRLTLSIDGVVEIDIQAADLGLASFPPGNLGFYNYSQSDVRYSLLSPRGRSVCVIDPDDRCTGFDDSLDADSDGIPDGCDVCAGADDATDADSDGVPDGCDACASFDDAIDGDNDGLPDGCDVCAADPGNDTDGDGICAALDNCPATDNQGQADLDGDGVGDACDDDRYGIQGGSCSAATRPADMSGMLIILALALLHGWYRRRKTGAA
ncbi:MAG TPA: DUF4215 domain-containing protein [Haliangium sp.]|nr:DUF4215 domain-containing protein [Haliangium sp.]